MHNDKYIKTKIKIYTDRVYTNFQHNKIPKDIEYCECLSVILLDSILVNSDKEYYPQIFLEERKYAIKDGKIVNTINEDLELSESDKSDSNTAISCNAFPFSYPKSVNNLEILVSLSNKRSNNSSLLFSTSSFNFFISFIFSFADNLNFLSFSKSYHFSQNLHLSPKVVKFKLILLIILA